MKLYEILKLHGAPRDSWTGIQTLAVAKDDESLARHIDEHIYNLFTGYIYDDEGNESDEEEFSQEKFDEVMENCGDLESDEGWDDAYYGVTKCGWKEICCHINPMELQTLKQLNIRLIEIK